MKNETNIIPKKIFIKSIFAEIKYGKWQPICEDGTRIRVLDYVLPLTSSIGPDSSRIVEKQVSWINFYCTFHVFLRFLFRKNDVKLLKFVFS